MELFNSTIILIIIALIWTAIIFLFFKRMIGQQTTRDKKMLLGGLLLFVALATLFVVASVVYEEIESPGFCGTFCHVMKPYYETYLHPGDNQMMATHVADEITCSNCHNEPGIVGTLEGLLSAIPESIIYFTNSYDVDDLGGDVSRAACLKCHDGSIAITPSEVTTAIGTYANPHNDEKKCTVCHNPHLEGSGLGNEACSVCHGTEIENFEEKLLAHSDRAGAECNDCHNRKHPEDAKIAFSEYPTLINTEFCSDCHGDEAERLDNKPHKSKSCFDCHDEHASLGIEFSDCGEPCHNPPSGHDTSTSDCSVCHDTTKIHLSDTDVGEFKDVICSNCHEAENTAFESSFTSKSLEIYGENGCVDCHSEHSSISYPHQKTSPYNMCGSCHTNYEKETTIHDRTEVSYLGFSGLNDEFCSECHQEELDRLGEGIHFDKDCIDCHGDHATTLVDFEKCSTEYCHVDTIPESHDESQTACSDCHNTEPIHSEPGDDSGGSTSNGTCLSCHDGSAGSIPPTEVTTAIETKVNPHSDDKECTECHTSLHAGFNGLSKDACAVCHGTAIDNFEEKLIDHSNKAGADCMNCHNREHPTNANIPFTDFPTLINDEFCSDCHDAEYSSYTSSFTEDSLAIYGETGCQGCHAEHKAISYPHQETSPYDACSSCHNTYGQETTVHDRTEVSYQSFSGITNDFCSDCHDGEVDRLNEGLHSSKACIDCHSEHNKISVKFENCGETCHDSIPDWHDTTTTGCTDCHIPPYTKIHSES